MSQVPGSNYYQQPPAPAGQYGAPSYQQPPPPAGQYGAPSYQQPPAPAGQYGTPSYQQPPPPAGQYGAPSYQHPPPAAGQYGAPSYQHPPAPAGQYGAPSYQQPPPPAGQYGAPSYQQPPPPADQQPAPVRSRSGRDHNAGNRRRSLSPAVNTKIDPETVPQLEALKKLEKNIYKTSSKGVPPCATSAYSCFDDGNASPRHMRMTMHAIPGTKELTQRAGFVIGLCCQPFVNVPANETPQDMVVTHDPVRCKHCKAYINAWTKWRKRGKVFICNICGTENDTPEFVKDLDGNQHRFMCQTDQYGNRADKLNRAELKYGVMEYIAPRTYHKLDEDGKPVQVEPGFLFVLDVSAQAINSGLLTSVVYNINEIIKELREDQEAYGSLRFGVITYDHTLHFHQYDTKREFVVTDVDNPFLALPGSEIMVRLDEEEKADAFLDTLNGLEERFQVNTTLGDQGHCVGAAMSVARDALLSSGGKVVFFQTSIPSCGAGKIDPRFNQEAYGTKEELATLRGNKKFYNDLAASATDSTKVTCAFDVFVCSQSYVDLASVAEVVRATGGQIYHYENYQDTIDSDKMYYDLRKNIVRFTAFDCLLAVRASWGLEIVGQMGSLTENENKDVVMPACSEDSTLCIKFNHFQALEGAHLPCVQVACLYTASDGTVLIRVLTLQVPVAKDMTDVFRHVDLCSVVKFSIAQVAYDLFNPANEELIAKARENLVEACTEILYTYRHECAEKSQPSQLVLPESLKLLPMFTLSMIKNPMLCANVPPDKRVAALFSALFMSVNSSAAFIYPHMYPLHKLKPHDCTIDPNVQQVVFPKSCSISKRALKKDGLYLLNTGAEIYIIWGEELLEEIMNNVFEWEEDGSLLLVENPPDDPEDVGWKVKQLVDEIRWNRPYYTPVKIVQRPISSSSRDTTVTQREMLRKLLQDATRLQAGEHAAGKKSNRESDYSRQSYVDFLVSVHKKIQNKALE